MQVCNDGINGDDRGLQRNCQPYQKQVEYCLSETIANFRDRIGSKKRHHNNQKYAQNRDKNGIRKVEAKIVLQDIGIVVHGWMCGKRPRSICEKFCLWAQTGYKHIE